MIPSRRNDRLERYHSSNTNINTCVDNFLSKSMFLWILPAIIAAIDSANGIDSSYSIYDIDIFDIDDAYQRRYVLMLNSFH
mmetsp:Transcript_11917/g.25392  ORF Transcript_11917/g.25392 Transcript_11917/m.25392 type:complete len:81 (-) Transcript_11917:2252-2494(-)